MWYLNVRVILSLIFFTVLILFLRRVSRGGRISFALKQILLLCFSIGFLFAFGKKLTVFYVVYSIVGFVLCRLIYGMPRYKKSLFYIGILFNLSVLCGYRLIDSKIIAIPSTLLFVAVGLAYNMLKSIDALYIAYFAEQKVTFLNYMNYILFIPTFTSGPLVRYWEFERDMSNPIPHTSENTQICVKRVIKGLFKKVVLVELLMIIYETLLAGQLNQGASALVLLTYYVMLYFDFSGYSDIAIGFGMLLGFKIPENFKRPFTSPTLTQFWRNWHVTLGDWFRDHVFVFFIKENKTRVFAGFLSFVIMLLIGLWHGFSSFFILWGIYHGILLFLENLFNITTFNKKKRKSISFYTRCLVVNLLVAFGTVFFTDGPTAARIFEGFTKR